MANVISEHACVLYACSLNTLGNSNITVDLIFKRVQKTHVKLPERVQRKLSSVFSESAANYEAFCQLRIKT
jgi:hypothetical protein